MALGNKIIELSGVSTKYHRISNIDIDFVKDNCTLLIEDYMTEDYRKKAKEADELRSSINKLIKQAKTDNKDTSDALMLKANNLYNENKELLEKNFVANVTTITLDFIPKKLTYETFYKELKKLEKYKDADMI